MEAAPSSTHLIEKVNIGIELEIGIEIGIEIEIDTGIEIEIEIENEYKPGLHFLNEGVEDGGSFLHFFKRRSGRWGFTIHFFSMDWRMETPLFIFQKEGWTMGAQVFTFSMKE